MGEILRMRNLRICIFPKDHLPAHLHVLGPGAEAKFEIETLECFFFLVDLKNPHSSS